MKFEVQFSVEAAAELLRFTTVIGSAVAVLKAAENIRSRLENDPSESGIYLSEGLYFIDEEPLRAFFFIHDEVSVVEITDFRIL